MRTRSPAFTRSRFCAAAGTARVCRLPRGPRIATVRAFWSTLVTVTTASALSTTTAPLGWARTNAGTSRAAASMVRFMGNLLLRPIRVTRAGVCYWTLVPLLLAGAAQAQVTALEPEVEHWSGDFDGMFERRVVRVLVPYSRTLFFNDKGAQRGLVADALKDFEVYLNKKYPIKNRPITVVALPTTREELIPGLLEGRGDIAMGNLTITPERAKRIDFSTPTNKAVLEIVVTGPASPPLAVLDDLAGHEVHVRRSSSYHDSLTRLNRRFLALDKPQMKLTLVPDALEDEDMMDMLAVGLLKVVVVDDWKAKIWGQLLPKIKPRPDLALRDRKSVV